MKRILSIILSSMFLVTVALSVTSCNIKDGPKVQNVGKVFDNLKQISGNLFYDTNNDNMVYKVTYNSVGDKVVEPFEKEGKYYTYDSFSNEVVFLDYSDKYNYSGTNISGLTETTTDATTNTESTTPQIPTTLTTTEPAPITVPVTEATTKKKKPKKTKPKTTTRKQTQRLYATRKVYTTKKVIRKTTKKPTTTKKMKVFKFDGEKYYIDDSGKWIKIK